MSDDEVPDPHRLSPAFEEGAEQRRSSLSPPTIALTSASLRLNSQSVGKRVTASAERGGELRQRFVSDESVVTFDTLNDFESPLACSSSEFESEYSASGEKYMITLPYTEIYELTCELLFRCRR